MFAPATYSHNIKCMLSLTILLAAYIVTFPDQSQKLNITSPADLGDQRGRFPESQSSH